MDNLYKYVGKRIRITCVDEPQVEGKCVGYTQALDNEPEVEELDILTTLYGMIGVTAPEMISIEVLE